MPVKLYAMETNRIILEAIARGLCVSAVYNRLQVVLAPHILYTRHDELFVDAVTVEREGQAPREIKLGTFKLIGLKDVALASRSFAPDPIFDPREEKYVGETLFAVAPETAEAA
jgi:hypothetical protein